MKALGSISRRFLAATVCLALNTPALALETDQFYAWGKPIEDSTNYLNAWVWVQVQDILDEKVNGKPHSCEAAVEKIQTRLQHSIFQPIEVWINSSRLVDRIPRGVDEYRDYRDSYLLSKTYPLDTARGLQPSPTIEVNGIRIGSQQTLVGVEGNLSIVRLNFSAGIMRSLSSQTDDDWVVTGALGWGF